MTDSAPIPFPQVYEELAGAARPSPATLRAAFDAIFAGAWTAVQIAGFVIALRFRGEDEEVITCAIQAMRAVMIPIDHGLPKILDTAGTGGDGKGTLNLSTAAAIVVAACGLPVAKHGNRSISSRTGSADVLEALGIPIDLSPARHAELLREVGITFLFAPAHHPALRNAMTARRELGVRTVFNALGPIANPARATHQLIGTYDDRIRPILAGALGRLGARHAWVVRGEDGLDEVSPHGPTRVTELTSGALAEIVVRPEDFGIRPSPAGAIAGGTPAENASRILAVLRGEADPALDAVVLNAAAAIAVGRDATSPPDLLAAAALAREAIQSGAALRTFEAWRRAVSPR
jgi:anthranilate phosphoribosyltransferase